MKALTRNWAIALATAVTIGSSLPLMAQDAPAATPAQTATDQAAKKDHPRGPRGDRPRGGGRGMRDGAGLDRLAERLKLEDAQKEQIKTILEDARKSGRALNGKLNTERQELNKVINASPVDEVAIRAQAAKVAAVEADQAVERAHVLGRVKGVLTPEQQAEAGPALEMLVGGGQGGMRGGGFGQRGPRRGPGAPGEKPAPQPEAPAQESDD